MASAKTRSIVQWGLAILLGLFFLMAASGKFRNMTQSGISYDDQFILWGYPPWARFVVGTAEAVGAILVFLPRTRFYGAALITALMAGAIPTHLRVGETMEAAFPAVFLVLAATLAWMTRPAWVRERLARRANTA
ncbi:MAG: DoxX family protein [Candidatus Thermoplasmatota archaeon]